MPVHESELNTFFKTVDAELKLSEHILIKHEGVTYRAHFQFPSKYWSFWNEDKKKYFGTIWDHELKPSEITPAKALEALERKIISLYGPLISWQQLIEMRKSGTFEKYYKH